MNLGIENKVFIITGGSKGIGEGITRAIIAEAGIPVIASRSEQSTIAISQEFNRKKIDHLYVIDDLSESKNCKKVIDETVAKYNRIDGVVNNAGVNDGIGLEAGSEAFRNSINLNLFHYYDMVHYALPFLKKSKGSVVNISSKVALAGQGNTSGYAAAKGAQLALTREWAADLLRYGIRVNAVVPSEVMTPQYKNWLLTFENSTKKEAEIKAKIPLQNRMTTIEEIASMVVFLLSEKSSHTTGQIITVDGGYLHLDRSLT